tara:strand:+ start:1956 stop:2723 length:768 start_codon:yes stop_codon:yes gene_type:complete
MISKKINKDGYYISKNFFKLKDIEQLEKTLHLYATLYIKNYSNKLYTEGRKIIKKNNNNFRLSSLRFFDKIEKNNQKAFYEICKNISKIEVINTFFRTPKVEKFLKNYFGKSYLIIQKKIFLLFNSKNTRRLILQWHQECHFYSQKKGFHLWFPVFRNVKAINDGALQIAEKSNKKVYGFKIEKTKNGYLQKIPNINVDHKFNTKGINLNRGDALIIHHNTFHKTDNQLNTLPRLAIVVKFLADGDKEKIKFVKQ